MITRRGGAYWKIAKAIFHEYPRAFWVLMAGWFIDELGTNMIIPFLALYLNHRFSASMTQIGTVFAIIALAGICGSLLSGAIADRFGRRTVMVVGLVCGATLRLAMGMVGSLNALYITAIFAGFFGAVGSPARAAMIADLLPEDKRADGYGIQRIITNVTFVLGPLIGGVLATQSWYLAMFVVDAVTSYIMAAIVVVMIQETAPQQRGNTPRETLSQTLTGYARVTRDKVFMVFAGLFILVGLAYMQMYVTLSVFVVRQWRLPESFFGLLLMFNAGSVILLQFPITRWASRKAPMLVMMGGTAFYLVGLGAYGVVVSQALYVVAILLIATGEMLVVPTAQALAARLAPEHMRARYAAVYGLTWTIPQAFAPLAAGAIMDHFDPRWVWYGCAIICFASIVGLYRLHIQMRATENPVRERTGPLSTPAADSLQDSSVKKLPQTVVVILSGGDGGSSDMT